MNEAVRIAAAGPASTLDRFLRDQLVAQLSHLRHGRLIVSDALGSTEFGDGASLTVSVTIHDMSFYRRLAVQGSVGAGDAYGDGLWSCENLVALVRLLVRNRDLLDAMETKLARFGGMLLRTWHALRRNTRDGSRRNIAAHYDLGNAFFASFLSKDMVYSSALWHDADDTLEQASTRKLEVICRKLDLHAGQRVMEIGTGWGGFAVHAAKHHGCQVTTTTISRQQQAFAQQRVREEGLEGQVTVLLKDYRDLEGQYDKLVSIEMIEAIGAEYLQTYFAKVSQLLAPRGQALIQAITIEDHRYLRALQAVDFIKRFIFPGSFIPSINALLAAKTRASELALVQMEDFGDSYARTLHAWRTRFMAALLEIRAHGYDERFVRLWEFYLAYCEGGFLERSIGVCQLLFTKPGFS